MKAADRINYIIFTLLLIFTSFNSGFQAWAQTTNQLSGRVVDETTQQPVPFAQVALYPTGTDQPVTGANTQADGTFSLAAEPGVYDLAVVLLGYKLKRINRINLNNGDKNLRKILLQQSTQQLEEVVVKAPAKAKPITTNLEGLTVRPDQTIANVGGSLLDVLRNTPSVNVSQDGSISLRGSNTTNILIDGRNSALATDLEQIPASAIESIQIINNPNAKYDAQGAGGVINIVLKRGEEAEDLKGTNGKAQVTIGTRGRLNSSIRLNHRGEKFNVFGGYSFRRWPNVSNSNTIRETFENNQRLEQYRDARRSDLEHTFNAGADYFFGKNKLSYEGTVNLENESDRENSRSQVFDRPTRDLLLQYTRANTETENNHTLDNALIYERLFEDPDRKFRVLASHSYRDQSENQNIDVYSGTIDPSAEGLTGRERSVTDELRQTTVLQADYTHPLGKGKIETGYKSIFRAFDNNYLYEIRDQDTETWVNRTDVSNRFLYKDQIHAAYFIYSHKFEKFDISVGTRAEQTLVDTKLFNTDEVNHQRYLNFFPSLQAVYRLDKKNALKFTYSRRIDRPGSWRLNPFPDISDSLNVRQGNPALQPEYINSFEIGHMVNWEKVNLTTNAFFRKVNGQVDYLVRVEDGISYRQPANLNSSVTYGLEIISTAEVFPWWNFNASYTLFQTEVDGTNLNSNFTNSGLSWNAKVTTELNLPYSIDMQLTGNYTAAEIEAQGRDFARYYMDISLKRAFFNNKGSISLSLRDVFNTRRFAGENATSQFRQTFSAKRETRILLLSLGYKF